MKRIVTIFVFLHILIGSYAQEKQDSYRRSSLCSFFITDKGHLDRDAIPYMDFACKNYKIPIKYDLLDLGFTRSVQINKMRNVNNEPDFVEIRDPLTGKLEVYSNRNDEYILLQYMEDNKFANKLLAKWFNASDNMEDGSYYNMKLIQERGAYSASELEKLRADESVRGRAILADAGMELLSHTYVTFTYFDYFTSQSTDAAIGALGGALLGTKSTIGSALQKRTTERIENISGYGVFAHTWLFRLKWSKAEEELFLTKYYNAPVSDLLNSNDFHMECVGFKKGPQIRYTKWTGQGKRGNALMAEEATIRAIDKSLNELQRKFEDFKVKASLIEVEEGKITAFIGTKEGVTTKSKFEVLERVYDEKEKCYNYKKVGTLSVDPTHPVFDNYYVFGQEEEPVGKTYFKGNASKLAPGMLIRQIK